MCHAVATRERARPSSSPSDCHPQTIAVVQTRAEPLGIDVAGRRRSRRSSSRAGQFFGVLLQYPTTDGRVVDYARCRREGARRRRAGRGRDRSARADAAHAARRVRRRHRDRLARSASACRWASAARTRRSSPRRTSTSARCRAASSASRKDAQGQPGLPPRAADPRAAHPPREGDQQHLHRAGAARRDGEDVRRLSRARGPAARSPSASTRWRAALADGPAPARASTSLPRAVLRHPAVHVGSRPSGQRWSRPRARRGHQPAPLSDGAVGICAATRPRPPTRSRGSARASSRQADRCLPLDELVRPRSSSALPAPLARTSRRSSRTRSSTATTPRHEMLRYMQPARGAGPLAHHVDDPARLVHDEAQRDAPRCCR